MCEHVSFTFRALGSCGHQRGQFVAGGLTWAALRGASQPPRLEGTLPLSSRGQPGSKDTCRARYSRMPTCIYAVMHNRNFHGLQHLMRTQCM